MGRKPCDDTRRAARFYVSEESLGRILFGVLITRIVLVLAFGVLVTGCAQYRPEPLSPSANAIDLEKRTLDDPRLRAFMLAILVRESESVRGPPWDLTTLNLAAVYYHPDLDIARARLATANARVITAGQRPNPILKLSAGLDTAAVPGAITPGALPLTIGPLIDLIVETFGKREYRTAQALHLVESARWGLATAVWRVRGGVRTALLNLWAARQRTALTRQRLDLQEQLTHLLERRLEVGEANAIDVTRERLNRAQIAVALRDFERAAATAEAQLAAAVGIPAHALAGVKLSFGVFEQAPPLGEGVAAGELRRRALTGRTDVQAALAEYAAAQSELQLQVANQYPNVTLGPGYEYDAGLNRFNISPAAELPIFNQNQGQIAEAGAKRLQAAADFTALQAQIIGAIDTAVTAYGAARRSLETSDGLLAAARRREGQIATSFRAGQIDRPTLVTAELETTAVRLARLDAVVAQLQAVGALEDALQQPLFEPTAMLSVPETSPRLSSSAPS